MGLTAEESMSPGPGAPSPIKAKTAFFENAFKKQDNRTTASQPPRFGSPSPPPKFGSPTKRKPFVASNEDREDSEERAPPSPSFNNLRDMWGAKSGTKKSPAWRKKPSSTPSSPAYSPGLYSAKSANSPSVHDSPSHRWQDRVSRAPEFPSPKVEQGSDNSISELVDTVDLAPKVAAPPQIVKQLDYSKDDMMQVNSLSNLTEQTPATQANHTDNTQVLSEQTPSASELADESRDLIDNMRQEEEKSDENDHVNETSKKETGVSLDKNNLSSDDSKSLLESSNEEESTKEESALETKEILHSSTTKADSSQASEEVEDGTTAANCEENNVENSNIGLSDETDGPETVLSDETDGPETEKYTYDNEGKDDVRSEEDYPSDVVEVSDTQTECKDKSPQQVVMTDRNEKKTVSPEAGPLEQLSDVSPKDEELEAKGVEDMAESDSIRTPSPTNMTEASSESDDKESGSVHAVDQDIQLTSQEDREPIQDEMHYAIKPSDIKVNGGHVFFNAHPSKEKTWPVKETVARDSTSPPPYKEETRAVDEAQHALNSEEETLPEDAKVVPLKPSTQGSRFERTANASNRTAIIKKWLESSSESSSVNPPKDARDKGDDGEDTQPNTTEKTNHNLLEESLIVAQSPDGLRVEAVVKGTIENIDGHTEPTKQTGPMKKTMKTLAKISTDIHCQDDGQQVSPSTENQSVTDSQTQTPEQVQKESIDIPMVSPADTYRKASRFSKLVAKKESPRFRTSPLGRMPLTNKREPNDMPTHFEGTDTKNENPECFKSDTTLQEQKDEEPPATEGEAATSSSKGNSDVVPDAHTVMQMKSSGEDPVELRNQMLSGEEMDSGTDEQGIVTPSAKEHSAQLTRHIGEERRDDQEAGSNGEFVNESRKQRVDDVTSATLTEVNSSHRRVYQDSELTSNAENSNRDVPQKQDADLGPPIPKPRTSRAAEMTRHARRMAQKLREARELMAPYILENEKTELSQAESFVKRAIKKLEKERDETGKIESTGSDVIAESVTKDEQGEGIETEILKASETKKHQQVRSKSSGPSESPALLLSSKKVSNYIESHGDAACVSVLPKCSEPEKADRSKQAKIQNVELIHGGASDKKQDLTLPHVEVSNDENDVSGSLPSNEARCLGEDPCTIM